MKKSSIIVRFALLSVFWLALLLPAWYWAARWLAAPAVWLAGRCMQALFAWAQGWEQDGMTAVLHTLVQVRVPGAAGGQALGEISTDASYPTYGYGIALLWAMLLAARTPRWYLKGLLGSALLLPAQAWGICFHWLRNIVLLSGPEAQAYLHWPRWSYELVAYGYQFGFLMLTPLMPIFLWLMFNKRFVAALWLEASLDESTASGKYQWPMRGAK